MTEIVGTKNNNVKDIKRLLQLCEERLAEKYTENSLEARDRMHEELDAFKQIGAVETVLRLYDLVCFAKENGLTIGPGRGSAPSSIVFYLLGITDIDPIRHGLYFERFLNLQRDYRLGNIILDACTDELGKMHPHLDGLPNTELQALPWLDMIRDAVKGGCESYGDKTIFMVPDCDDEEVYDSLAEGNVRDIPFLSVQDKALLQVLRPKTLDELALALIDWRLPVRGRIEAALTDSGSVSYLCPEMELILKPTNGCIVWQETIMQILHEIGGLALSTADIIRRAMGKKQWNVVTRGRQQFLDGVKTTGIVPPEIAGRIYDQLCNAACYALNKSHFVAYAKITYTAAWLRMVFPGSYKHAYKVHQTNVFAELCEEKRNELYGLDAPDEIRFRVKAAIEKAYDADLIRQIMEIYEEMQNDSEFEEAMQMLSYLLGFTAHISPENYGFV